MRRPDYSVEAHVQGHGGAVGEAWRSHDGTIHIELAPFVVLSAARGMTLVLVPVGGAEQRAPGNPVYPAHPGLPPIPAPHPAPPKRTA